MSVAGSFCKCCRLKQRKGHTFTPQKDDGSKNKKDYRGMYICKICGMSFKSLNIHLKKSHKMSLREYTIKFGIQEQFNVLNKGTRDAPKVSSIKRKKWLDKAYENERAFYACNILKRHNPKIKEGKK